MSDTHFVVERVNWRRGRGGAFVRHPGAVRVAAFDAFADASAFRWAEETRARAAVNPFAGALGCPAEQSHLPEPLLHDWLLDHGVEPPAPAAGRRDWAGWWAESAPGWTDAQRAAAWEALDKVRFFRVTERPRRPVGYAVVRVIWGYNDEWFYPGGEGGETQTVYRTLARAEAECREQNEVAREQWTATFADGGGYEPAGLNQFEMKDRLPPGYDPFGPPPRPAGGGKLMEEGYTLETFAVDEVPFFEVVEVELEGMA